MERGIFSQSSDEDDGPACDWSNVQAGRMRGYGDEDSQASEDSAASECESDGIVHHVVRIDEFDFASASGNNVSSSPASPPLLQHHVSHVCQRPHHS